MSTYNHFKGIPELPERVGIKKRKPKLMAVVDEDNCTGCQVCAKVCTKMTWDAIRMMPTEEFEETYNYKID